MTHSLDTASMVAPPRRVPLHLFPMYVDLFRPALVGRDVTDTAYVSRLAENYKIYGPGGYHTQVLAAINQACWDIRGKIEGKIRSCPTWRHARTDPHLHCRWLLR